DRGKARTCWQRAANAPRDGMVWAKTEGPMTPARMTINGLVYRHEFGSLRDAEVDAELAALPDETRDLALHLIASHHGHARPTLVAEDEVSPPSLNQARAREAALRFVRLQRRWGPWGLAWWEALLRAADRRASRRLGEVA
ncbi:MAG: type I-U CRISPR-associated helicase/endonuclease Cas3, partial [Alphaproteobacteria bacterium]|nr:type I-U CRISPR-associated helicase/endonuclease Cas3 [Alphaproteobacteria bacterium]